MPSKTDFNVSPYYDDFSEDKKFHRVMYRPAFAVQARELTTQQTILQNQIEKLGDSMYKHGSMMIQAFSNARVPKVTLLIGASFGAGNYGMCGIGYEPDFIFSWPNAKIGVMGGKQAAQTMEQVALTSAKKKNIILDSDELSKKRKRIIITEYCYFSLSYCFKRSASDCFILLIIPSEFPFKTIFF